MLRRPVECVAGVVRVDEVRGADAERRLVGLRVGAEGIVSLFRFGVAVLFGMSPLEEDEVLRRLEDRVRGKFPVREEESAQIGIGAGEDEQITPSGTITSSTRAARFTTSRGTRSRSATSRH